MLSELLNCYCRSWTESNASFARRNQEHETRSEKNPAARELMTVFSKGVFQELPVDDGQCSRVIALKKLVVSQPMTVKWKILHGSRHTRKPWSCVAGWPRAVLRCWPFFSATWLLAQDPGVAPGDSFDLSHWSLTLPDPNASVIEPAELTAGFSNAYFYTGADGAMVFWVPVTGGTTSASDFPRSELRERLDPDDNSINWSASGAHVLNATCRVTQLPSTKRVVIGQIHSYLGDAPPLVLLVFNDGNLEGRVKLVSTSTNSTTYLLGRVALGNDIQYQLQMREGVVSMTVNGSNKTVNVLATDPAWETQTYYFKAGAYCLDQGGLSSEGAKVRFFQLDVQHDWPACVITNVSANPAQCCVTWTSEPGVAYYVQGLISMSQPDWLTLSPNMMAKGDTTSFCIPLPSPYRFFRVGMVTPLTHGGMQGRANGSCRTTAHRIRFWNGHHPCRRFSSVKARQTFYF